MPNLLRELPFYIGNSDLPEDVDDGLVKGGMYSIGIQLGPTRLGVVTHTLLSNLARNIHCVLITRLGVEEIFSQTDQTTAQILIDAIEQKKLFIFSMVGDYAKNMFRFGPKRLLDELDHFDVPTGSLIVVDHADRLFTLDDHHAASAQAEAYREWFRRTGNTGLFLFLQSSAEDARHAFALNALSDYFSGLAKLYVNQNCLETKIDFWTLQSGIVLGKLLPVQTDDNGRLLMAPSLSMNRRRTRRPYQAERTLNLVDLPAKQTAT
jgi:hypothetical protein